MVSFANFVKTNPNIFFLNMNCAINVILSKNDTWDNTHHQLDLNPYKPIVLLWDIGKHWRPRPDAAERGV